MSNRISDVRFGGCLGVELRDEFGRTGDADVGESAPEEARIAQAKRTDDPLPIGWDLPEQTLRVTVQLVPRELHIRREDEDGRPIEAAALEVVVLNDEVGFARDGEKVRQPEYLARVFLPLNIRHRRPHSESEG